MNGDNGLREILPLLRPRTAEPTLFIQVVWYLLWVGIAVLLTLYVTRWIRHRRRLRQEFTEAARQAGLKASQTELLFRIARSQRMKSPPRLLTSPQVFDRQLGAYAGALAAQDRNHPELAAIGAIRKRLGFDRLEPDQALTSTRQVEPAQTIMLRAGRATDDGLAHSPYLVLDRDEGTLTLAPILREGEDRAPRWKPGQSLSGLFWREGDTEYRFATRVVARDPEAESIDLEHAPLERLQNRDFFRIDVDVACDFYLLPRDAAEASGRDGGVPAGAAIELLDEEGAAAAASQVRVAPAGDGGDDPLAAATRLPGRVVNLSAGGLAVDVAADGPLGADELWIVDPAFDGPFPLAGLRLIAVGTEEVDRDTTRVKLTFVDLPTPVEKAIVRRVYELQLQSVSGRSPAPDRPMPRPDDLPVR